MGGFSCWNLCKATCDRMVPIGTDNMEDIVDAANAGDARKIGAGALEGVEEIVENRIGIDAEHFSKMVWDLMHGRLYGALRHAWNLFMDWVTWLIGEKADPSLEFDGENLGDIIEGVLIDADPDKPGHQIDFDQITDGIEGVVDENKIDIDSVDGKPDEGEAKEKPRGYVYQILRLAI